MTVNYNLLKRSSPAKAPIAGGKNLLIAVFERSLIAILQSLLNTVFATELSAGEFDFIDDQAVCVNFLDLAFSCAFALKDNRFVPASTAGCAVGFSGNSADLLLLVAGREDPDALFFQRKLKVEGDTELGLTIKNLVFALDPDELPPVFRTLLEKLADIIETLRYAQDAKERCRNKNGRSTNNTISANSTSSTSGGSAKS